LSSPNISVLHFASLDQPSLHCYLSMFLSRFCLPRNLPLSVTSYLKSHHQPLISTRCLTSTTSTMSPTNDEKSQARSNGHDAEDIEGEHNEWKFDAPYKIHSKDGEGFKALYEGSCHCGRVKYQLSRERPLDAKFCHCTTCQVIHGIAHSPTYPSIRPPFRPLYPCPLLSHSYNHNNFLTSG
jgi:hypothetical protein